MKLNNTYLVWTLYFVILLCIALFVKDVSILYSNNTFITAEKLAQAQGYGDPKTFITTALQISQDGWITDKNQWVFNLWPPGFILLETIIIKLFGPTVPIVFVLQILAAILFATVLTFFYKYTNKYHNKYIAFTTPLLIFIFPVSRAFLLETLGISFGESFSIGLFLLFVLLALFSVKNRSLTFSIFAGICLGFAAYFRSSFGAILISVTFFGMLIVFLYYLLKIWKKREILEKNTVIIISTIIVTAILISLPWKIYKFTNNNMGTHMLIFKTLVKSNETLRKEHAGWVIKGRGNMICLVDKSTCDNKNSNAALLVTTFLTHPIKWYSIKAEVIGKYWFANIDGRMAGTDSEPTFISLLNNSIILIMLLSIIVISLLLRKEQAVALLIWVNISLFSMYSAVFTIVHYETRYFYFPKIYIIFVFMLLMLMYTHYKRSKEDSSYGN